MSASATRNTPARPSSSTAPFRPPKEADERIKRVLTNDPMMGIFRHADAGYETANAGKRGTGTLSLRRRHRQLPCDAGNFAFMKAKTDSA